MKRLFNIFLLTCLINIQAVRGQRYAALIWGDNGVVAGDTISMQQAHSIKGVECIEITKSFSLKKHEMFWYRLLICEGTDSTVYVNNKGLLSAKMRDHLSRVKPGAQLYFEGLQGILPKTEDMVNLSLVKFVVK